MNRIKCSVSSCKYNDAGEECMAKEITVRNNMGESNAMEFGNLEGNVGSANADTSMETCCETFIPKKQSQQS